MGSSPHEVMHRIFQIVSCTDLDTLNRWFTRAITATSVAEVFGDDLPGTGE